MGIHDILGIKSHQIQWNLTGIHENLAIKSLKSHQIQWNLMGPIRF